MRLRTDERQWLIYQEPSVVSAVRAVELVCMLLVGPGLAAHPEIEMRALGNAVERIADARLRYMLGLIKKSQPSDEERVAGRHAATIYAWLNGGSKPEQASDELWAAVYYLDSYVKGAGIEGAGWQRELVKGVK